MSDPAPLLSSLPERLRGTYRLGVNDGAGPLNGSDTFTRQFETPPIQHEAAKRIELLEAELRRLVDVAENLAGEMTDPGTEALAAIYCSRAALIVPTPVPDAATYNAVFDPANEAGQEMFNAGFREGWIFANTCEGGDDYDEAAERFSRSVDGVEMGEAWDAHRDTFFARLPLAALPPRPAA